MNKINSELNFTPEIQIKCAKVSEESLRTLFDKVMKKEYSEGFDDYGDTSLKLLQSDYIIMLDLRELSSDWDTVINNSESCDAFGGNLVGFHEILDTVFYGVMLYESSRLPVFAVVYFDGTDIRGYIPKSGNFLRVDTMESIAVEDIEEVFGDGESYFGLEIDWTVIQAEIERTFVVMNKDEVSQAVKEGLEKSTGVKIEGANVVGVTPQGQVVISQDEDKRPRKSVAINLKEELIDRTFETRAMSISNFQLDISFNKLFVSHFGRGTDLASVDILNLLQHDNALSEGLSKYGIIPTECFINKDEFEYCNSTTFCGLSSIHEHPQIGVFVGDGYSVPVFVSIYLDNLGVLRTYVPTCGNVVNPVSKSLIRFDEENYEDFIKGEVEPDETFETFYSRNKLAYDWGWITYDIYSTLGRVQV